MPDANLNDIFRMFPAAKARCLECGAEGKFTEVFEPSPNGGWRCKIHPQGEK